MMKERLLVLVVMVMVSAISVLPTGGAVPKNDLLVNMLPATAGRYVLTEQTFTIQSDRTVDALCKSTIANTSSNQVILSTSWSVPTSSVTVASAWDDYGTLSHDIHFNYSSNSTTITVQFRGDGVRPGEQLTYHIGYTAAGLALGSSPEYRATLGGLQAGGYPHDNCVVTVIGPSGTSLFLTNPQADTIENDPPTVRYHTSIGAQGTFSGLLVGFYRSPTYYKHTLVETLWNMGTEVSRDIVFDTILFPSPDSCQSAAFVGSNQPMKTMWVDKDNSWHAAFDVGSIQPWASKELRIDIVSAHQVYAPSVTENNAGELADVPAALSPYTKADNYWEVNNMTIQQQAAAIVGGETNSYRVAERIVEWVDNNINYQVTAERAGALLTLQSGTGDCDGFSDLTIALSRAAGLPAREVFGWGFRENTVGHAWVEFYLPNWGWQPADPTWAKVSGDYLFHLDPIHIARSVRGLYSSETFSSYAWSGGEPTVGVEQDNLDVLTESEAAQAFVQAAASTITIASNLLASRPDAILSQELQIAQAKLAQAQAAVGATSIALSQEAIQHANIVIQALGVTPEVALEGFSFEVIFLVLGTLLIVVGVAVWLRYRNR